MKWLPKKYDPIYGIKELIRIEKESGEWEATKTCFLCFAAAGILVYILNRIF